MSSFKSITGKEVNNPNICIGGNGNFACVCKSCISEFRERITLFRDEFDKVFKQKLDEKVS